ncbi:hypothetical protein, partial [Collinsella aerofaciens]|uniref:hypothetical protein n=1 Tax=Collinsella aerofaciens TaxID=74426 RepID=UPI00233066C9
MHVAITPTWREPKQKRGLKGRAPSLIQIYIARNGSAEVTQARGQPSFPAHSAGRKNLRRTKCELPPISWTQEMGGLFMAGNALYDVG